MPRASRISRRLIRHNPEGNDKIMIPWGVDEYLPTETSAQIEGLVRQAASKIGIPVKAVLIEYAEPLLRGRGKKRDLAPNV